MGHALEHGQSILNNLVGFYSFYVCDESYSTGIMLKLRMVKALRPLILIVHFVKDIFLLA